MLNKKLNKFFFFLLSCTWGLPMTLIGGLVAAVLLASGRKPHRNQYGWYFIVGQGHSGVSFGPIAVVNSPAFSPILFHEFGHGVQNCYFGPFMIIISLISVIRYWYRRIVGKRKPLPPYDSIWFEGQATALGEYYYRH